MRHGYPAWAVEISDFELVRWLRSEVGDALKEARTSGTCVPAVKIVLRSLKEMHDDAPSRAEMACARGCSFCCHNAVSVSAPEAFRLAEALARLPEPERREIEGALRARAAQTAGLSLDEQARRRTACALLAADGACRLHAARPLPCISITSFDAKACERAFHAADGKARIPVDGVLLRAGGAHNLGLRLAARDAGLDTRRYELHDALVRILDRPDAEERWLAGEDVFAGCRTDRTAGEDLTAIETVTRPT